MTFGGFVSFGATLATHQIFARFLRVAKCHFSVDNWTCIYSKLHVESEYAIIFGGPLTKFGSFDREKCQRWSTVAGENSQFPRKWSDFGSDDFYRFSVVILWGVGLIRPIGEFFFGD